MNTAGTITVWVVLTLAYWTPSAVALLRRHQAPHYGSVIVVNLFLGWTVIGWIVALAMACRSKVIAVRAL